MWEACHARLCLPVCSSSFSHSAWGDSWQAGKDIILLGKEEEPSWALYMGGGGGSGEARPGLGRHVWADRKKKEERKEEHIYLYYEKENQSGSEANIFPHIPSKT